MTPARQGLAPGRGEDTMAHTADGHPQEPTSPLVDRRHALRTAGIAGLTTAVLVATASQAKADPMISGTRPESVFIVEDYAEASDTADHLAWQRAIDAAIAANAPSTVLGTKRSYLLGGPVTIANADDLTIRGAGKFTTMFAAAPGSYASAAFTFTGRANRVTFSDFAVTGGSPNIGLREDGGQLRPAAGTFPADRIQAAINGHGNYSTGDENTWGPSSYELRDITVRDVAVFGTLGLPIFLQGISGQVTVQNTFIHRCLDTGFISCESIDYSNNHVEWSSDNGVSLSRLNRNIRCVNNYFYGSYVSGIWTTDFQGDPAPQDITITGNVVELSGSAGIRIAGAAKHVTVTGNVVKTVLRGANDAANDGAIGPNGVGIYVAGSSSSLFTEDVTITGNVIIDAYSWGIMLNQYVRNVSIVANTLRNIGQDLRTDGVTYTQLGDIERNVAIGTPRTVTAGLLDSIVVSGNSIADDRLTANPAAPNESVTKEDIWLPGMIGGAAKITGNISRGITHERRELLEASATHSTTLAYINTQDDDHATQLLFRDGADLNMAIHNNVSNGVAGIAVYDASGSRTNVMSFNRDTDDAVAFSRPVRVYASTTANRKPAASAGVGAVAFDSTLNIPLFSDGTSWRDAAGNIV
jgi:hypothetical protein